MKKGKKVVSKIQKDRAPRIRSSLPVEMNGKSGVFIDISTTGVLFEIDDLESLGPFIHFYINMDTPG